MTKKLRKPLSIVLTLMMIVSVFTIVPLTASAEETEELLITIKNTGDNAGFKSGSKTFDNLVTLTFSASVYNNNDKWGWYSGASVDLTVTPVDDSINIKKVIFYNDDGSAVDEEAPFVATLSGSQMYVNGNYCGWYGVNKIEVYGYEGAASVPYMAWDEDSETVKEVESGCEEYTAVESGTTAFEDGKWYVVSDTVEVSDRIIVNGTANLILCDDTTLTAGSGIEVNSGNTLNIYAQSSGDNMGKLIASGTYAFAGIGSCNNTNSGEIYIHGGNITATSASTGAGIGGGRFGTGTVTIYGGDINATGGDIDPPSGYAGRRMQAGGAGIGNGGYEVQGGSVTILGGTITANGGYWAAGIGGGSRRQSVGAITIKNAKVTATGNLSAAGIGAGSTNQALGAILIENSEVTATGGENGAGIGGGSNSSGYGGNGADVTIINSTVIATGNGNAVGIGHGTTGSDGALIRGIGMKVETSTDNTTWTVYDGSTRTKYMKVAFDPDQEAADEVAELINALPDEVTADDAEAIEAARAAYEALTDEQKELVDADALAKLEAAEETLNPALVNESEILTASPIVGTKLSVQGAASGGAGDYTYAFYYRKSTKTEWYQMAEPYTTTRAAFKPTIAAKYDVKVIAKDANGNTEEKIITVKVNAPLTNKSEIITTEPTVGEKVRVKGAASGGAGDYTYEYYYKKSAKDTWYKMTASDSTKTAAFRPAAATSYDIKVIVTDADGNTAEIILTVDVSVNTAQ